MSRFSLSLSMRLILITLLVAGGVLLTFITVSSVRNAHVTTASCHAGPWGCLLSGLNTDVRMAFLSMLGGGFVAVLCVHWALRPWRQVMRSLEGVLSRYRDGDFSSAMRLPGIPELRTWVQLHNELGDAIRQQRHGLVQRELMLDTVVQNTPVALVLTDAHDRIVYANQAARLLFYEGRNLQGQAFSPVIAQLSASLLEVIGQQNDALLPIKLGEDDEIFHISQRNFRLQGRLHRLHLFRQMTRELARQEVDSWKRLIRVISHELNNSLAPISSLAHSGAELVRRGELARVDQVLTSISERSRHLHSFINAYASFSRLPKPQPRMVSWADFVQSLHIQIHFHCRSTLPSSPGWFDPIQIEQVLINLLKNASEACEDPDSIEIDIIQSAHHLSIEVLDRGPGMSEAVLSQALLPFYSTKRSGTGLGLALAREIIESHQGKISLSNRRGGGLRVYMRLPRAKVDDTFHDISL